MATKLGISGNTVRKHINQKELLLRSFSKRFTERKSTRKKQTGYFLKEKYGIRWLKWYFVS
ncbi:hypothetical protein [Peribacillus cavernae]|uniref:hypothetical protein n=1 Tax=Peribacillus cavernae TaxID=1674310 RepID=UPI001FE41323|nr:hypothetical protein [Peribacillus cavernae]